MTISTLEMAGLQKHTILSPAEYSKRNQNCNNATQTGYLKHKVSSSQTENTAKNSTTQTQAVLKNMDTQTKPLLANDNQTDDTTTQTETDRIRVDKSTCTPTETTGTAPTKFDSKLLPDGLPNLIVGSSILKHLNGKRLDYKNNTEIRTLRGASIQDLWYYINRCQVSHDVKNLIVLIGSNNSSDSSCE
ncbi:hypothetical protein SNE40_011052 [Patella caerulea]